MVNPKRKRISLKEKKSILLEELRHARQGIITAAKRFHPSDVDVAFVGSWTILDLLAHLVGWDFTNIQAAQEILNGQLPDFYAHYDKDWASYNAELVSKYKENTLEEMISSVEASHGKLLQYLETLSPEQIFQDQGVRHGRYKVIISRLLEADKKDVIEHSEQIDKFLMK